MNYLMSKKRLIILALWILVIASIAAFVIYYHNQKQTSQSPTINKSEVLKVNEHVSKNPAVLQIRTDLNSYLSGKITEKSDPLLVNGDTRIDRKGFLLTGLKNFSKDYYKSKFIVLTTMSAPDSGETVYLEFIDKPDKVFTAGVFPSLNGNYKLGYFGQNQQVTQERLQQLNTQYEFLLQDKAHAL